MLLVRSALSTLLLVAVGAFAPADRARGQVSSSQVTLRIKVTAIAGKPRGAITVRYESGGHAVVQTIKEPHGTVIVPQGATVSLSETPSASCLTCPFRWWLTGNGGTLGRGTEVAGRATSFQMVGQTKVLAAYIRATGDVSLVSPSPDESLTRLPLREVHVSAQQALAAAEPGSLSTVDVDPKAGMVHVGFSVSGDPQLRYITAWIIVADMITYNPAPGSHTKYRKMCVVVDATTGNVVLFSPTDPMSTG